MRNFLIVLVCAASIFMSYSRAQIPLDMNTPIPVVAVNGESTPRLAIRFDEPLTVRAGTLIGSVEDLRQEARGRFSFFHGRLIRGEEGERLLAQQSTTVCTLVTTGGDFFSGLSAVPALQLFDFTVGGDLPVQEVFLRKYKGPWAMAATLPLDMTGRDLDGVAVREVQIVRSYHGQDEKEFTAATRITPASLRECLGPTVSIIEIPAGHTAGR